MYSKVYSIIYGILYNKAYGILYNKSYGTVYITVIIEILRRHGGWN